MAASLPSESEWMAFTEMVSAAAKRAFSALRKEHRDERFYVYALYSDDGAMTVCPAANSEEAFDREVRRRKPRSAVMLASARWSAPEWAYEDEGGHFFNKPYDHLEAMREKLSERGFARFRKAAFEAMIQALEALDKEGFFGKGAARESVTLLFTVSDAEDYALWERRSVRRLNPASVARRFLKETRVP